MRILIAHNYYQQPGGEDVVFEAEARLLESRGHTVVRHVVHNNQIKGKHPVTVAAATIWNRQAQSELHDLACRERIEVAHFHNTFPLISPAAYSAVRSAGAAVVQTLHNHRLLCPNALLYRDGHVCHDCVGRSFAWPGIVHGCYRGSRAATATVALLQAAHNFAGTYRRKVDIYIAPSQSMLSRMCAAGLPMDRVVVKPHFVEPDLSPGNGNGGYAVFLGRLSGEKGLQTLLRSWTVLPEPRRLMIIGDGPLAHLLRAAPTGIEWMGRQPLDAAYKLLGDAAVLIFPSECHETFGRAIAEAFAKGTPVIASNLGSAPEMVDPGRTGMLFEAGNAEDLAVQVHSLYSDPLRLGRMRLAARQEYDVKYRASSNYEQLIAIYERSLAVRHSHETCHVHYHKLGRRQPA